MPMTITEGDGKALAPCRRQRHNLTMSEESNVEDVAQSENTEEVRSLTEEPPETLEEAEFNIGDVDTAEGQARRAEEAADLEPPEENSDKGVEADPIEDQIADLKETVEDLPPLPTEEEAEMGQLFRTTPKTQFGNCELVDNDTPDLIGVLEEEEPKGVTDEEVRQAVLEVEGGEN